jgi:phytoene desaturase
MVADRYATYAGSDPRRAPAALAVIPFVEQTFGAWHAGGGLGSLAEAVYQRCLDRGVTFRFGAPVAKILVEGSRASGVLLRDGEQLQCDIVVSDVDAATLYGQLLDHAAADRQARRLARLTPSLSGFAMLLALRGRTEGLQHHTVLFPDKYHQEFDDIFGDTPRPPNDPAIYICNPDDRAMRPDDHEAWFVLVNAPPHDPEGGMDWRDSSVVDGYARHVLALLARRGLDVRDRLLWHEIRTPVDIAARSWSPGGAIYGTASNSRHAAFTRPANRSPVSGIFLVGGSTHPGGGLPLVGMSAAIVADLIGPA